MARDASFPPASAHRPARATSAAPAYVRGPFCAAEAHAPAALGRRREGPGPGVPKTPFRCRSTRVAVSSTSRWHAPDGCRNMARECCRLGGSPGRGDVSRRGPLGPGVVDGAPSLPLHSQPFLGDGPRRRCLSSRHHRPVQPSLTDRILRLTQEALDVPEFHSGRGQADEGRRTNRDDPFLPFHPILHPPGGAPGRGDDRWSPPPSASFCPALPSPQRP